MPGILVVFWGAEKDGFALRINLHDESPEEAGPQNAFQPASALLAVGWQHDDAPWRVGQAREVQGEPFKNVRSFFAGDLKWLSHYGFSMLDVPTLGGGLSN